jgi:cell division protein FtsA
MLSLAKEQMVRSGYFHRLAVGAVLTGGGSQLEGLLSLAKQVFGLPVRLGRPLARGPANLKDPRLSTSVGLLLYGSHEQVQSPSPASWSQVRPSIAARFIGWWKHLFGP